MLKIQKILLPVDFQRPLPHTVHQAATLARHFRSEIILLHAVTPLSYSAGALSGNYIPGSREELLAELLKGAQEELDRSLQPELSGVTVKRLLRNGDPAHEIVQAACDEKVDLIVMPTHGYGGFRRFLLGSVTAKVLHDSECPVWTGAHVEDASPRDFAIRKIVCAVDLSPHSRKTVFWAAQMAAEFGARLTLAHVVAGLEIYNSGGTSDVPEWRDALISLAAEQIAKLQQDMGTQAETFIDSGDAPKTLSRAAEKTGADLLVIGRSSPGNHLGGSGYGIVRESPIPVLSV